MIILLTVVTLKLFVFELYLIPSESMANTIITGDIVFVSKISYGPRIKTIFDDKFSYHRLGSIERVKRYDIVVFNYPNADSIINGKPNINYYEAKSKVAKNNHLLDSISYQPVNSRQPYIKRCIGLPGDTISLLDYQPYINGEAANVPVPINLRSKNYQPSTDKTQRRYPIQPNNPKFWGDASGYRIIFPNNYVYRWNHGVFGPVYIPKKGATIELNLVNIWLYKRVIENYEHNQLSITAEGIFINGSLTTSYTFQMNYFFMMGDNRQHSKDSMFWGFVPEDHIIGKALFIGFSKNDRGILWNRAFKVLH